VALFTTAYDLHYTAVQHGPKPWPTCPEGLMQPNSKPVVKTRKSGVRYVEAADILRSESGRDQIRKASRHSESMRRNAQREADRRQPT
jgi:hypothetical protein